MPANEPSTAAQKTLTPTEEKIKLIAEAKETLRGARQLSTVQLKDMYTRLEHYNQFAYATEVLLVKMEMDEERGDTASLKDYQKLALYIYKDHSLPSMFKFKKALQELQHHDELAATTNCESLGLAGAIYKRKWQFDHQFKNLILSRYYYKRGFKSWQQCLGKANKIAGDVENDDGYTAINYAYLNELMAVDKLEEHGEITGLGESINENLKEAAAVRTFILKQFTKDVDADIPELNTPDYPGWVLATVAEAYFGLRKYKQAILFIEQYIKISANKPWEIKSFNQQLFSIAYLQERQQKYSIKHLADLPAEAPIHIIAKEINTESIYQCLACFTRQQEKEDEAIETRKKNAEDDKKAIIPEIKKGGKLGLALSGGGFRASLFHIGALAALAEKDELRNVEVLSCVSGGSIIGAYYYIKLKHLLETKSDGQIDKQDYIDLVKETEKDFLTGIQKNLRVRIFSNLACNLKMLTDKNYSRTHRLGELYEEHLYKKIWPANKAIYMNDLFIKPFDAGDSFNIGTDNWKRKNKIPQLVLNATSVNTGHNWQFTASWMGEPPGNIQAEIDVKPRLRRMYYEQAPAAYQNFKIGYAVGASSCVPVIFHPMPMYKLYPDIELQLVDGGLHDNQGIAALIEQECSNMIVSDASGQLPTEKVTAGNEATLFYRADSILQERLRELQFMDLQERNYTSQLNQYVKMHLKNDLRQKPKNWIDCIDPPRDLVYEDLYEEKELTTYGILKSVQNSLAGIRTDLDSFSNAEAYALMYSGYLQTHFEWNKQRNIIDGVREENHWTFCSIREYVTIPSKARQIEKVLTTGSKVFS